MRSEGQRARGCHGDGARPSAGPAPPPSRSALQPLRAWGEPAPSQTRAAPLGSGCASSHPAQRGCVSAAKQLRGRPQNNGGIPKITGLPPNNGGIPRITVPGSGSRPDPARLEGTDSSRRRLPLTVPLLLRGPSAGSGGLGCSALPAVALQGSLPGFTGPPAQPGGLR